MVTVEELINTTETAAGENRMAPSSWYKRGGHLDNGAKKNIF